MRFFIFHRWPLQLLINNPVFYYNICCFSTKRHIQSKWIILSYDHRSILEKYILEIKRLNCLISKFLGFDFDLERSFYCAIRKPVLDFISIFYWHFPSISYLFKDIWLWSFEILTLTFNLQGSSKVKNMSAIRKSISNFYLTSIDTFSVSRTVFEIFYFKVFMVWPLTFKGQTKSKIPSLFGSPYTTSYLTSIDTFSLSRAFFKIFDFKVFMVLPWPLTFKGHLRSKIFSPVESSYMTSYLTSIDTFSLSPTVFKIFDFKIFMVRPWPLTFRGYLGSKIF